MAKLNELLQGSRFGSYEEVIAVTETYFGAKDKSLCKKGIETLEKLWNECSILRSSSGHGTLYDASDQIYEGTIFGSYIKTILRHMNRSSYDIF